MRSNTLLPPPRNPAYGCQWCVIIAQRIVFRVHYLSVFNSHQICCNIESIYRLHQSGFFFSWGQAWRLQPVKEVRLTTHWGKREFHVNSKLFLNWRHLIINGCQILYPCLLTDCVPTRFKPNCNDDLWFWVRLNACCIWRFEYQIFSNYHGSTHATCRNEVITIESNWTGPVKSSGTIRVVFLNWSRKVRLNWPQ